MVLQSAHMLSTFGDHVFLSPALSPHEMEIEKKILKKRWELISNGTKKEDLKI